MLAEDDIVAIGDSDDDDAVVHDRSTGDLVPCEVCGLKVPFNMYTEHVSRHAAARGQREAAQRPAQSSNASVKIDVIGDDMIPDHEDVPTPQRKRARLDESHSKSSIEIDLLGESETLSKKRGSDSARVPCEVCGAIVSFHEYEAHAATHNRPSSSSSSTDREGRIPCDVCGDLVLASEFARHAADHKSRSSVCASYSMVPCQICSVLVESRELADHTAAHQVHEQLLDADLQQSTSEVDITVQIVDMARKGGSGLPGNRHHEVNVGDAAMVRWRDGHWYHAHVQSKASKMTFHVTWDPPFAHWQSEDVSAQSIIPRGDQAREVCNFDVALAFVRKLKSLQGRISTDSPSLEIVYHYTREENVSKIVENNLKVPGSTNADGSKIDVKNGSAYGVGIYAATNMSFGQAYGGGLSCAFMCLAIPGRTETNGKLKKKSDSLQNGALRVYSTSEQLLPLFFTNSQLAPGLEKCATEIIHYLEKKLVGKVVAEQKLVGKGEAEVEWHGLWWKANVIRVLANGKYDVSWLPPYSNWPPEKGVPANRVRLSQQS